MQFNMRNTVCINSVPLNFLYLFPTTKEYYLHQEPQNQSCLCYSTWARREEKQYESPFLCKNSFQRIRLLAISIPVYQATWVFFITQQCVNPFPFGHICICTHLTSSKVVNRVEYWCLKDEGLQLSQWIFLVQGLFLNLAVFQ